MGNSTSVTLREFARQIGRSHTWVQNKVKSGELPRNDDGTIPVEEGFKAFNAIVREVEQKKANRQKQTQTVEALPDNDDAPMQDAVTKAMSVTEAFNKARLAEKTYQAKLKEIEYKLKRGDLIESEKVIADAQATAALVRERLMSIPVRVSGLCEGRTARDIEEILEDAINDVLKSFQKSEYIT